MEKKFEIPKNPEGVAMAQKFQDYLKSLGVDASKLPYSTMLKGLEFEESIRLNSIANRSWISCDHFLTKWSTSSKKKSSKPAKQVWISPHRGIQNDDAK